MQISPGQAGHAIIAIIVQQLNLYLLYIILIIICCNILYHVPHDLTVCAHHTLMCTNCATAQLNRYIKVN